MTRGKLILIYQENNKNKACISTEFNGDMYVDHGHGTEIIEAFQTGKMDSINDFQFYVMLFDHRNFRYADEGDVLTYINPLQADKFNIRSFSSDYLYIVNSLKTHIKVITAEEKGGSFIIPPGHMAIVYFKKLDEIIKPQRPGKEMSKHDFGISREEFVKILVNLEAARNLEGDIYHAVQKFSSKTKTDFQDTGCLVVTFEDTVIDLLQRLMHDDFHTVEYFVYETNFGHDYKPGCVKEDNEDADISTAEKLYDYLKKKMEEC